MGNGELEVVSGTASSGSSATSTMPTAGSTATTPDTPASGFMKFDWDGNGFNRFEIRTKTDEEWNPVYTDSEGSMTEEHINKHDFTLKLENTYKSEGDVESSLTSTGDVDASGTGSASSKRFVDYKSNDRVLDSRLRLYAQPAPMIGELRVEPDHERHASYTKTIESSASFDGSRDPQLVIDSPTISGSSRVNVTGYHNVHIRPFHHAPSMDYHEGADMDLADGSGTNYGDSYWNQTWPIVVDPNYDPRNDFEKSLQAAVDAAVLELTSGSGSGCSCSASGSTGTGASGLVGEGEDPGNACRAGNMAGASRLWGSQRHAGAFKGALEMQSGLANMTPGVGAVLGAHDAVTGTDSITGESLTWWQRLFGVAGAAGGAGALLGAAGDAGAASSRAARAADTLANASGFGEIAFGLWKHQGTAAGGMLERFAGNLKARTYFDKWGNGDTRVLRGVRRHSWLGAAIWNGERSANY